MADTTALLAAITKYTELLEPATYVGDGAQEHDERDRFLVRDTMRLLSRRLDRLMRRYEFSDAPFHRTYTNARIIIDQGSQGCGAGGGLMRPELELWKIRGGLLGSCIRRCGEREGRGGTLVGLPDGRLARRNVELAAKAQWREGKGGGTAEGAEGAAEMPDEGLVGGNMELAATGLRLPQATFLILSLDEVFMLQRELAQDEGGLRQAHVTTRFYFLLLAEMFFTFAFLIVSSRTASEKLQLQAQPYSRESLLIELLFRFSSSASPSL
ncbi:MAG: hypothetical protein IPN62_15365 [Flavobacteriales bacterium]|nr:hypothetical protein [Flavobacteriales bacterium]